MFIIEKYVKIIFEKRGTYSWFNFLWCFSRKSCFTQWIYDLFVPGSLLGQDHLLNLIILGSHVIR